MRLLALVSMWFVAGCHFDGHADAPAAPDAGPNPPVATSPDAPAPPPVACEGDGDDDHDGICNSVDDWPCGEKPAGLGSSHAFANDPDAQTELDLSQIVVGTSGLLAIRSGTGSVALAAHFSLHDTGCSSNCIDQIEYGLAPDRSGCMYDAAVDRDDGASGDANVQLATPTVEQPTVFDLRARIGKNWSCTYQGASSWYYGEPNGDDTIAKVCVY